MRWLVAFLLLTSIAFAQSQPPSHAGGSQSSSEQKPTSENKQKPEADQRGTDKSLLIVKIQNSRETETKANQEAKYQEHRTPDERIFEVGIWSILVGFLQTIALFITFLVIAYVGIYQLRAYINPSVREIKKFSLTEHIVISVGLKNEGQTPAHAMETQAVIFVGALPLGDDAKMNEPKEPEGLGRHSKMTLYPKGEIVMDVVADEVLTAIEIAALKEKKWAIYIAGEVRYRDISRFFKRTSQFCIYVDPDSAVQLIGSEEETMAAPRVVNFITAHVWNRAT